MSQPKDPQWDSPGPTDPPCCGSGDPDPADIGLDEGIDWADLQDFFFEHLSSQLPQMERLLRSAEWTALARIGHGLKGSGGGVQLPRFTELGSRLEQAGKATDARGALEACRAIRDEFVRCRPQASAEAGGFFLEDLAA